MTLFPELSTMTAMRSDAVVEGCCVVIDASEGIVYVGPLDSRPLIDDMLVLLSPADFQLLSQACAKARH